MALVCTKFLEIAKFLIPVVCIYMHKLYKYPSPTPISPSKSLPKAIYLPT